MLRLFLIRHAKSSWDNPALRDFQRPLNARGLIVGPQMAQLVKRLGIQPDLIVSSPARRAIDTAAFFAEANQLPFSAIQLEATLYEAQPIDLMRAISQLPDTAKVVFMVGHNPGLTELVNQFLEIPLLNLPTCGIVALESTANNWSSLYEENTKVVRQWFPKTSL